MDSKEPILKDEKKPNSAKLSGYLLFSSETREQCAAEHKKITIAELGKMWSDLSEKERQKFNDKAAKINNNRLQKKENEEKLINENMRNTNTSKINADSNRNISRNKNLNNNKNGSIAAQEIKNFKKKNKEKIKEFTDDKTEKIPSRNKSKPRKADKPENSEGATTDEVMKENESVSKEIVTTLRSKQTGLLYKKNNNAAKTQTVSLKVELCSS